MTLTMTDLFCGAGGSSSGAIKVPEVTVRIAANHWALACEVHNLNHQNTDHAVVDLHQEDPAYFPRTDLLWASPECRWWTQANGKAQPAIEEGLFEDPLSDEAATRSRLLMFDVLRFIAHHRYRAVIVENVVDIATQAKYRLAWAEWRRQLANLGYAHRVVSLNSMHAQSLGEPAPQSRDRIYIVCWPIGDRAPDLEPALRPSAWCPRCDRQVEASQSWKNGRTVGKYRTQYLYVHGECGTVVEPAWLPAAAAIDWSIPGERFGDKPRADKTRLRIAHGIARYWSPLHIEALGNQYDAADPKHPQHGALDAYYRAWPVTDPIRTLNTRDTKALVTLPFIAELRGGSSDARPVSEPASTFCASGNHHALVTAYYGNTQSARPASDPLGTLTTHDRYALVHRNNSGGAEMTTAVFEELRTLTTSGHQSLLRQPRVRVTPANLDEALAVVDDVLFRMFRPHEVAAGMAFPRDYRWDVIDPVRRKPPRAADLTKMAGNAVTPPAARDLVGAVAETLR